jgi:hypothetical protein
MQKDFELPKRAPHFNGHGRSCRCCRRNSKNKAAWIVSTRRPALPPPRSPVRRRCSSNNQTKASAPTVTAQVVSEELRAPVSHDPRAPATLEPQPQPQRQPQADYSRAHGQRPPARPLARLHTNTHTHTHARGARKQASRGLGVRHITIPWHCFCENHLGGQTRAQQGFVQYKSGTSTSTHCRLREAPGAPSSPSDALFWFVLPPHAAVPDRSLRRGCGCG